MNGAVRCWNSARGGFGFWRNDACASDERIALCDRPPHRSRLQLVQLLSGGERRILLPPLRQNRQLAHADGAILSRALGCWPSRLDNTTLI